MSVIPVLEPCPFSSTPGDFASGKLRCRLSFKSLEEVYVSPVVLFSRGLCLPGREVGEKAWEAFPTAGQKPIEKN